MGSSSRCRTRRLSPRLSTSIETAGNDEETVHSFSRQFRPCTYYHYPASSSSAFDDDAAVALFHLHPRFLDLLHRRR